MVGRRAFFESRISAFCYLKIGRNPNSVNRSWKLCCWAICGGGWLNFEVTHSFIPNDVNMLVDRTLSFKSPITTTFSSFLYIRKWKSEKSFPFSIVRPTIFEATTCLTTVGSSLLECIERYNDLVYKMFKEHDVLKRVQQLFQNSMTEWTSELEKGYNAIYVLQRDIRKKAKKQESWEQEQYLGHLGCNDSEISFNYGLWSYTENGAFERT